MRSLIGYLVVTALAVIMFYLVMCGVNVVLATRPF